MASAKMQVPGWPIDKPGGPRLHEVKTFFYFSKTCVLEVIDLKLELFILCSLN